MKIIDNKILVLIEKRQKLKEIKDYLAADEIRSILTNNGILIKDTREGTEWDIDICPKIK